MRSMWKGAVSFGLVSIPVNLYTATESKNVGFHQVHEADGGRVRTRRVCSVDGEEVPYHDIAKGHELPDGSVVVITDADLASLSVPSAKSVDVLEFVPLESIDPIYFDKTYYLEPQEAGLKPYLLLRDALHKSGQVAVTKIALRQRESLAVLRVHADCLVLSTMLWPDEVRAPDFAFLRQDAPPVRDAELAMAGSLISSMSEHVFEPEQYTDTYRAEVESLIASKVAGKEVTAAATEETGGGQVVDLMAALTASIDASRARAGGGSGGGTAVEDPPAAEPVPVARKTPAKKAPAKKTPAKKTPAEQAAPEKTPAKKPPAAEKAPAGTKAPAKKAPAKKVPAKKAAATKP